MWQLCPSRQFQDQHSRLSSTGKKGSRDPHVVPTRALEFRKITEEIEEMRRLRVALPLGADEVG